MTSERFSNINERIYNFNLNFLLRYLVSSAIKVAIGLFSNKHINVSDRNKLIMQLKTILLISALNMRDRILKVKNFLPDNRTSYLAGTKRGSTST